MMARHRQAQPSWHGVTRRVSTAHPRRSWLRTALCTRAVLLLICIMTMMASVDATTPSVQGDAALVSTAPRANLLFQQRDSHFVRRAESEETESTPLPTGARTITGQPPPTNTASPRDPLLAIMPEFAFSMPAQVVVDGITLSLTTMLLVQLIFTVRYHYPLSKRNYCLQSFSTFMLLVSLAVHLHTVLSRLSHQSHGWPYMFAYIAVQIPPQDGSWNKAEEAFYLLMRAISNLSIHLTHIQFLTLLFPSALEARLILWMLGPLALAASGMEFTALSSDDDVKTSDLGDAIRNICNSTLFLLYTSGLLIWGCFVNRRRAWRTDGGTAAFGGGSVGLALINTMVSFVEIAYDRLWWLPDICWTLTLWQSWLGFWWWVGSGMGIGEVEDRVERQERRRKRAEKLRRKRERQEKARQKILNGNGGAGSQAAAVAANIGENSSDAIMGSIRRIRDKFSTEAKGPAGQNLSRRNRTARSGNQQADEEIELDRVDHAETLETPLQGVTVDAGQQADELQTVAGSGSQSSDTHPTTSAGATSSVPGWFSSMADYITDHQPNFIRRRMRRLRLAHVAAARRAATEQSALRDQVLNRQSAPQGPGLRTMMMDNNRNGSTQGPTSPALGAQFRNSSDRQASFGLHASSTRDTADTMPGQHVVMPVLLEDDSPRRGSKGSLSPSQSIRSLSALPDRSNRNPPTSSFAVAGETGRSRRSFHATPISPATPGTALTANEQTSLNPRTQDHDSEWVDEEEEDDAGRRHGRRRESHRNEAAVESEGDDDSSSNVADNGDNEGGDHAAPANGQRTRSWAWRGGLQGLRMRDHTTYD